MKLENVIRYGKFATGWALVCLTVGSIASSPAVAQKPPKTDPKAKGDSRTTKSDAGTAGAGNGTMKIAKEEGKLEGAQLSTLKISTAANKELFLVTGVDTAVQYTGVADAKWLTPGLMVRFTASFDQGKPTGALKELEVFTPVLNARMNMEQQREQTPGIYQEGKKPPEGTKGLFAEGNAKKPAPQNKPTSKKEPKAPPVTSGQNYRVVGKLVNVQQNVLTIVAGQPMQVELDPAAVVSVTASDLNSSMAFAVQGDQVTVSGLSNPTKPEIIQAEKIEIKAAKKLEKPEATGRGTRGQPRGRDATDAKTADANAKDAKDAKSNSKGNKAGDKAVDNRKPQR